MTASLAVLLAALSASAPPLSGPVGPSGEAAPPPAAPAASVGLGVDLEVFTREGCPRCREAKEFLARLQKERPRLRVRVLDVEKDKGALQRLQDLGRQQKIAMLGVPAFLARGRLVIGYTGDASTGVRLIHILEGRQVAPAVGEATGFCAPVEGPSLQEGCAVVPEDKEEAVKVRWFGEVSADRLGLPVFTLVLGLLDGFNPCAMWVLVLLLSVLLNLKSRARLVAVGGTFVAMSGVVYFLFMTAWLNVMLLVSLARPVQIGLGLVAAGMGAVHLKDFVAFRKGVSLSIPESAKPGLYARMRQILHAKSLAAALASAVVLAFVVNLVELLCTAGLPAVYTHVLAQHQMPPWRYYGYLVLYNLAYMFDDSLLLAVTVWTLSRKKLDESGGRWLKLVSGALMVGLGALLLLKPEWLAF